jgi:hypothetical protein
METMNQKMSKALLVLTPNAEWVLTGDDYSNIQWLSDNINKPSWAEIQNEIENPTIREISVAEKLSSVGLDLNDLKAALGL